MFCLADFNPAVPLTSTAEWMQAWGTVVGSVLTGAAVLITGVGLLHEVRGRHRERQDAEAAQARLVLPEIGGGTHKSIVEGGHLTTVTWVVTNHSKAPIIGGAVTLSLPDGPRTTEGFGVLTPGKLASGVWILPEPYEVPKPQQGLGLVRLVVEFTDAAGLVWRRGARGQPFRVVVRLPGRLSRAAYAVRSWVRNFGQAAWLTTSSRTHALYDALVMRWRRRDGDDL
jgi:hypothetical protein